MADLADKATDSNGSDRPAVPDTPPVIIPAGKRGRGRPPGSKTGQKTASGENRAEVVAILDPSLIGDLFVSCAEIGDDVFLMLIMSRAKAKLTDDNFKNFWGEMQRIRLGEKDKKLIREAAIALAKKYPFLMRWGPEIMLLVCFVQYSARMGNALRNINAMPDLVKNVTPQPEEKKAG